MDNYTETYQVSVFNRQSRLANGSICPAYEVVFETTDLHEAIKRNQAEYKKINPSNQKRTFADIPAPRITSYRTRTQMVICTQSFDGSKWASRVW